MAGVSATGTTLGELGETEVLRRILPRLPQAPGTLLGPGDDAAVVAAEDGRVVATTDTMIHGPDFRLGWSTPFDLGWKAAATNLADVAAMGAVPTALLVAVAAPTDTDVSVLEGIADGLAAACAALAPSCGVVGGDLSVSSTLMIAVTALGDLHSRRPVLRSGARPGDVLAVHGRLDLAARGLALLFSRGVDVDGVPDAARASVLRRQHPAELEAQLRPEPPIAAGAAAAIAGATAMLDVSDGLAIDARRIAEASGVRIDLDPQAVGSREALAGGEAHALLAAFPAGAALPTGFRVIGWVEEGAGLAVGGRPFDERGGWDPYADWSGEGG